MNARYACISVDNNLGRNLIDQAKELWNGYPISWYLPKNLLCRITKILIPESGETGSINRVIDTLDSIVPRHRVFDFPLAHLFLSSDNVVGVQLPEGCVSLEFTRLLDDFTEALGKHHLQTERPPDRPLPYVTLGRLPPNWKRPHGLLPDQMITPQVLVARHVALVHFVDNHPYKAYTFNLRDNQN